MNNFDQDTINRMIDKCTFNMTPYDIAVIVHVMFKNIHRYIGNNTWEYFDTDEGIWKKDKYKSKMKDHIRTYVAESFSRRYMHWYDKSLTVTDVNDDIHYKFMAGKMLNISYQLKTDNFIFTVIKEAKSLFDIHNDD